jgi:hypothetical protein
MISITAIEGASLRVENLVFIAPRDGGEPGYGFGFVAGCRDKEGLAAICAV